MSGQPFRPLAAALALIQVCGCVAATRQVDVAVSLAGTVNPDRRPTIQVGCQVDDQTTTTWQAGRLVHFDVAADRGFLITVTADGYHPRQERRQTLVMPAGQVWAAVGAGILGELLLTAYGAGVGWLVDRLGGDAVTHGRSIGLLSGTLVGAVTTPLFVWFALSLAPPQDRVSVTLEPAAPTWP